MVHLKWSLSVVLTRTFQKCPKLRGESLGVHLFVKDSFQQIWMNSLRVSSTNQTHFLARGQFKHLRDSQFEMSNLRFVAFGENSAWIFVVDKIHYCLNQTV